MSARRDVIPARCRECGRVSERRPRGQTPEGWGRTDPDGQGGYVCPTCAEAAEADEGYGRETPQIVNGQQVGP